MFASARLSLLLAAAFAAATLAQAPKGELAWAHSVDAALKQSIAEKKPVLFVIMKDKEIGCKRMLDHVYTDEQVKARLAGFILLPCSTYDHTEAGSEACSQFKGVSCAEHQAIEREMRNLLGLENPVVAPQHIVVDSAGKAVNRHQYELKAQGFNEFLDRSMTLFIEGKTESAASKPAAGAESKPAAGGAAPADAAAKKLTPELEQRVAAIVKADDAGKATLTKELLQDTSPPRQDAFLEAEKQIKESKGKDAVIRAIGYPEFAAAATAVITLLAEKDGHARNCAVVTLEEMANPAACAPLIELFKKEKEPEIHKDIVRALGPCGDHKPEAKAILLKELGSSVENVRAGAAMSLGYFISGDAEVEKALKSRWEKDSSNMKVKIAILWGLTFSNDQGLTRFVDELTKDENNAEIKQIAGGVKARLLGGEGGGGGGGGGPPGGGGRGGGRFGPPGGGGGGWGLLKLLYPLYKDDKIVRNKIKDFRNFKPN